MRAALPALLILPLFLPGPGALAQDRVLFGPDRQPVAGYTRQVAAIADGDRLLYPGGVAIRVSRKLGCGKTTCVYEVAEPAWWKGKAVRVPMDEGALAHVGYFIGGEAALKEHGVPSVTMHASRADQFVIVEKIESRMRLDRLFEDPFAVPEAERRHLIEELKRFAALTRDFEDIADFRPDQLHYVEGRGWILADWNEDHRIRGPGARAGNVFDPVFKDWVGFRGQDPKKTEWLRTVQAEINRAVASARGAPEAPHPAAECPAGFRGLK